MGGDSIHRNRPQQQASDAPSPSHLRTDEPVRRVSEAGHRRDFNRVEDPALPDPLAIEKIFSRIESTFVLYRGLWTLRDAVP